MIGRRVGNGGLLASIALFLLATAPFTPYAPVLLVLAFTVGFACPLF